ncbi:MAG: class I SAM-dependent methyltransferase [Planctomycetes bacterium]|nr:class I SAM-dependent methyltransferase [Planctomycetota bacterium]
MNDPQGGVPPVDWEERYRTGQTPWDTGRPSSELQRVLKEYQIGPCRTLELGCGTGTNAVFLAERGFEVTACDVSEQAISLARQRADRANVAVQFLTCDLLELTDLGEPFPFVFDRGVYHAVRRENLAGMLAVLQRVTVPGSLWLTLAGNANDPEPREGGPPQVRAEEICRELEPLFAIVQLREFRFDAACIDGQESRPLGWSVLARRR